MNFPEEDEMTDVEIRLRYGQLINETTAAFGLDANYCADVVRKAKTIIARRERRTSLD